MQKSIIYDLEIIRMIPPKDKPLDLSLQYCNGWTDYLNMGISIITTYVSSGFSSSPEGIRTFVNSEGLMPYDFPEFRALLAEKPIVLGFNSQRFDDKVAQANGIDIATNYDIVSEIRRAAKAKGSYSLANLARANGTEKGDGALAPLLWQMGKRDEVIAYGHQEMKALVAVLGLGLRGELKNPNNDSFINLPATNLDMAYFQELPI